MSLLRCSHRRVGVTFLTLVVAAPVACKEGNGPNFQETLDIAVCAPPLGPASLTIDNPYLPLTVGRQWVLEGSEDGQQLRLTVTVLPDTQVVAGVLTRVVEEREVSLPSAAPIEISRNYFAQAPDGTVCYYGEAVDIYENGVITRHDGAWEAGVKGAAPGIFMPATPAVGDGFRNEVAPGVAEDRVEIVAIGESVTVPAGTFTNTVRFRETTPLEPGAASGKVYAAGLGILVDSRLRLVSHTP